MLERRPVPLLHPKDVGLVKALTVAIKSDFHLEKNKKVLKELDHKFPAQSFKNNCGVIQSRTGFR